MKMINTTSEALGLWTEVTIEDTDDHSMTRRFLSIAFNLGPGAKIGAMINEWFALSVTETDSYPAMPITVKVNTYDCEHESGIAIRHGFPFVFSCDDCGSTYALADTKNDNSVAEARSYYFPGDDNWSQHTATLDLIETGEDNE